MLRIRPSQSPSFNTSPLSVWGLTRWLLITTSTSRSARGDSEHIPEPRGRERLCLLMKPRHSGHRRAQVPFVFFFPFTPCLAKPLVHTNEYFPPPPANNVKLGIHICVAEPWKLMGMSCSVYYASLVPCRGLLKPRWRHDEAGFVPEWSTSKNNNKTLNINDELMNLGSRLRFIRYFLTIQTTAQIYYIILCFASLIQPEIKS